MKCTARRTWGMLSYMRRMPKCLLALATAAALAAAGLACGAQSARANGSADGFGATTATGYGNGENTGIWKRLADNTAIVDEGWSASDWAVVVASGDYPTAIPALGLAGLLDCPLLTTETASLSEEASKLITSKKVKNAVVVGGMSAISDNTFNQIKKLGVSVERVAGSSADETANAIYERGKKVEGGWGLDAIVAPADSYREGLAVASYAYAKKLPIFLATEIGGTLSSSTVSKIKTGGFTRTIILGGTSAVSSEVDKQVANAKRLAGDTAYGTSRLIAEFCVSEGMTAAHMGVAGGGLYQNAEAGPALCGKMNSALVLMDGDNGVVNNSMFRFVEANKEALQESCYVFGSEMAVSKEAMNSLSKIREGSARFLDSADISMSEEGYTYGACPITPYPSSVVVDGTSLVLGVDYVLSWGNNVDVCPSDADAAPYVKVVGSGDCVGTIVKNFAIKPADISGATVGKIADQTYTGRAITPEPAVTLEGKTLTKGTDYTLSYKDNVKAGTATVVVTGTGNYTGTATTTFTIKAAPAGAGAAAWTRLAGNTAIGTMKAIVNSGWSSSEWAIVATTGGYYDALSASGLAGLLDCPILMTASNELSNATKALIQSKKVKHVIVVGGVSAVSANVFNQIKALGVGVDRVAGNTAIGTANAIYEHGKKVEGGWGKDAVVATAGGYQDALSIAPYAYAKKAPIFLARGSSKTAGTLAASTLSKLRAGGFTRTIITGGTAAVSSAVDKQVTGAKRLAGNTAYGTCRQIADFCLANGMNATHAGVATGRSYQDALAGAALCGKNKSILVLADDRNSSTVGNVLAKQRYNLRGCYIFGGTSAVSQAVETKIKAASK